MPPLLLDLVCEAVAGGLCRTESDLRDLLRALERLTRDNLLDNTQGAGVSCRAWTDTTKPKLNNS
jgi:hypothetical protein